MDDHIVNQWLMSGQTARIAGFDFEPVPHPLLPNAVQKVVKGQAAVYFLRQHPHGHVWLLKKFSPSRRPSDDYLRRVDQYLPSGAEFFSCSQRRYLKADHLDRLYTTFQGNGFDRWLAGTILMPKVPGSPWASLADSLRDGEVAMSWGHRVRAGLNLAGCVERLETSGCSHRDLSSSNVFVELDGRVHLIDWDCLYHPSLPYQPNTTPGTMGYLAPFLKTPSGSWDAASSWCAGADRYALAILIAEILLIDPGTPAIREDGTLFAQAELDDPDGDFAQEQVDALWHRERRCGALLWKALHATSFEKCPAPAHWRHVLRNPQRGPGRLQAHHASVGANRKRRSDNRQGHDSLQITCEHCRKTIGKTRSQVNELRAKGSPLLCPACLMLQLEQWRMEQANWNREHPDAGRPRQRHPNRHEHKPRTSADRSSLAPA